MALKIFAKLSFHVTARKAKVEHRDSCSTRKSYRDSGREFTKRLRVRAGLGFKSIREDSAKAGLISRYIRSANQRSHMALPTRLTAAP